MSKDTLTAPFPYFGGKSRACAQVWAAFGEVKNYVEPFCGSAAMLLGAPEGQRVETINDADGFVANFWRSVSKDDAAVAEAMDWPVNECVPAGTLISTPGGDIPIEQITAGMVVLGESNGKVVETMVLAAKQSEASEFYGVGSLRLTGNHPVWTKEHGYLDAGNLASGMTVRVIDWPNNKLDLVMLKCNDGKQSLGNLCIDRPTDESNSLCGRDVPKKTTIQRAHVSGDEGRKNTQGLLDTVACCSRFPADISSAGNGDWCGMAGCGNTANCLAPGHVEPLQPHGRRGRDTGAVAIGEMQEGCFSGSQGHPLSAGPNWCNDREKSHAGGRGKDTFGGNGSRDAGRRKAKNIRSPQGEAAFNRAQEKTCECKDREEADRGSQAEIIRSRDSCADFVRGDGRDIPVNHCCRAVAGRERGVCVSGGAQGMPLQRESLQTPVAVYNFQTEAGNYFAEKVLVHNCDLFARHMWLVQQSEGLLARLHADPDYYDARIAGWWAWGACNWIGSGWCSGKGPWTLVDGGVVRNAGQGVWRQLPHLSAGRGVNRKLPHLGDAGRGAFIRDWLAELGARLRDVRVACGDWQRVVADSVTVRHGTTAVFLDPPYTKGAMDYAAGGVGGTLASDVRMWCAENGHRKELRIVLCGHAGEHDELLSHGWTTRTWKARQGYALREKAVENSASETLWVSPACVGTPEVEAPLVDLFTGEVIEPLVPSLPAHD